MYAPIIDEALSLTQKLKNPEKFPRLIYQRPDAGGKYIDHSLHSRSDVYFDYDKVMNSQNWEIAECASLPTSHPCFILYTSGTTGTPKGIVRDAAGTVLGQTYFLKNVLGLKEGEAIFAMSDIGWIVGHSMIVYGPQVRGARAVMFEGKPMVPDAGIMWKIIEKYRVSAIFTSPTAIRLLKKLDFQGEFIKKHDTSSLRCIAVAGEKCDQATIHWLKSFFPKTMLSDHFGQTETVNAVAGNMFNLDKFKTIFPIKAGSVTKPIPGNNIFVFDDNNKPSEPNVLGKIVMKLPLPPGSVCTLWGNNEAFIKKYLSDTPGYYTTGDAGYFDERNYLHIMARLDDVINTAGHRISTGLLEQVVSNHPRVNECAVVGFRHSIKGECPFAFVVVKGTEAVP